MTEEKLSPGALVKLKSGGVAMVYTGDDQNGDAICIWQEKDRTSRREVYPHIALEVAVKRPARVRKSQWL